MTTVFGTLRRSFITLVVTAMLLVAGVPVAAQDTTPSTAAAATTVTFDSTTKAPAKPLRRTDAGFTTMNSVVANLDRYTINLVGDARIEQVRRVVLTAVNEIKKKAGKYLTLTVGPRRQPSHAPARGEITVYLDDTTQGCGSAAWGRWIGCGRANVTTRSDGAKIAVAGAVYLPTRFLTHRNQVPVMTHELLHAVGLGHYDGTFQGTRQLMMSGTITVAGMQQGDVNGLAYLASNRRASARRRKRPAETHPNVAGVMV